MIETIFHESGFKIHNNDSTKKEQEEEKELPSEIINHDIEDNAEHWTTSIYRKKRRQR